jgi:hypothetical protein
MLLTQALTPTQLAVGIGVGTERGVVVDDGLLVFEEELMLSLDDVVVFGGILVVVEGFSVVVEGGCLVVEVSLDTGELEGCGDPPVIRFLIPRS